MFNTEERHSDQWFDQSRAKKIIFVLALWVNVYWGQYSPVTVFWSIPVSDTASVCAVLGHQMHWLKDLNGQTKPFLSGPFLRLIHICLCSCAWSSNCNVGEVSINLDLCFTWRTIGPWIFIPRSSQQNTLFVSPARPVVVAGDFPLYPLCLSYQ